MDEWIKKLWYIHTMEYYLAKKQGNPSVTTWAELEGIMLREVRQRKEKYRVISLICGN